jgi:hypothetical protein
MDNNMNVFNTYRIIQEWADLPSSGLSEDIESTLAYHDELNPMIWDGLKLKPEVESKLIDIAHAWATFANIPKNAVEDIILVGGNANFNYTIFSDLDLHLVVDKSKIADCPDLLDDYLMGKKQLWGLTHHIDIFGQPVELYAQDKDLPLPSGQGSYSILNDKWINEPKRQKVDLKDPLIRQKVKDMIEKIDSLVDNKSDDLSILRDLKNRIREMRGAAIRRGGEFALENLVFKELRNLGYLSKLSKYIRDIEDHSLSL